MTAFASFVLLLGGCEPSEKARQLKARELVGEHRWAEARAELEGIENLDANGWLAEGVVRGEEGDDEGALEAFDTGLALEPLPELYTNICVVRLRLEREAMEACQEAVLKAPLDARASVGIAEAATREGSTEAAKEALFTASDLVGDDRDTMAWMAEVWAALGELTAACTWGLKSGEDSTLIARSCLHSGQGMEALPMLERVADSEACGILATLTLDEAEMLPEGPGRQKSLGRADRWMRCRDQIEDASLLTDRGRLAMLRGDRLQAEAHWRRALELSPSSVAPRLNLARSLLEREQEEGLQLLREAADEHTANGLVYSLEIAALDRRSGRLQEAFEGASRVLDGCAFVQSDPCLIEAHYELARCAALMDDPDRSLRHLQEAVQLGGPSLVPRIERDPDFEILRNDLSYYDLVNSSP